jgi:predicted O-methyltransferase YrrM
MDSILPEMYTQFLRECLPLRQGTWRKIEEEALAAHIPIVQPEVGNLLAFLVELIGAKSILEIGTAVGYSTLYLADGLGAGGMVTTIEIDEERAFAARENFKRAGIEDKVHSLIGDAAEVMEYMNQTFDLIFLDAAKGQYEALLPKCLRLLRDGGLLIADNVFFGGMVIDPEIYRQKKVTIIKNLQSFLKEVTFHPALNTVIIPLGDGVSISRKREVDKD